MIADTLGRLRGLFGPPDPRTPEELEADLADELAFHMDGLEREARAAGADPEGARAEARRRFGDPDRIRAACRRVALEERFMLQRVHAVLTLILLVAVIAMGVQLYLGQAENARVLDRLEESLAALAQRDASTDSQPAATGPSLAKFVYLEGDVERPGTYELPPGGVEFSVQRLLAAAGGRPKDESVTVSVYRAGTRVFHARWDAGAAAVQDSALAPGDLVLIERKAVASRPPTDPPAGTAVSVRVKGPIKHNVGVRLDGGSRSFQSVMEMVGVGLADEHLSSVELIASVRRPRGDGGFDELPAQWLASKPAPDNPRLVAGDFVELSARPLSPPASLSAERVLELPANVLVHTAQLVQDAIARSRSEVPDERWPAGTTERLETDLAVLVARLKARGVEWSEKPSQQSSQGSTALSRDDSRNVFTFEGQVRRPGTLGPAGMQRGIKLERAIQNAGGLDVPYWFRESMQVRAVVRRPRGDGGQEVLEATWSGGQTPPEEPKLFVADMVTFSLEAVAPPRTLTDEERLGMTREELTDAATFIHASIQRSKEREARGEWPPGTTARLETDMAALVDRLKALGGTWTPADAEGEARKAEPDAARATGASRPTPANGSSPGSGDVRELQRRLQDVASARQAANLDATTKEQLKLEFDALLEAIRSSRSSR